MISYNLVNCAAVFCVLINSVEFVCVCVCVCVCAYAPSNLLFGIKAILDIGVQI